MKKLLLLALAALTVGTVSAQSISKRETAGKAKMANTHQVSTQIEKVKQDKVLPLKAKPTKRQSLRTGRQLSLNGQKMVSFRSNYQSAAPRKAPEFSSLYNGTALNYSSKQTETFVMQPVTLRDERTGETFPALENPVPAFFSDAETWVTYTVDASGDVAIPGQSIGAAQFQDGNVYEIFIENFTSGADQYGTIHLTLGEDGSLTCNTAYIAYTAYPEGTRQVGDDMVGWLDIYQNVKYVQEGKEVVPTVYYDSNDAIFHSGISPDAYSFNIGRTLAPGYGSVSFTNYTTDAVDQWQWNVSYADVNATQDGYADGEVAASGSSRDFRFVTEGGNLYTTPWVIASKGSLSSEKEYYTEEGNVLYPGSTTDDWTFTTGEAPVVSRANLKYGLTILEDINDQTGIKSYIFYQGKPATPLYFEGVNLLIYNFSQLSALNLKCKIQKVTRDPLSGELTMGEVIAEGDVDPEPYIPAEPFGNTAQLTFSTLAIVDEWGFKVDLDYLFVEDEFAIVIEGFDNNTFTGNVLCDDGAEVGVTSTYVALSGEEYDGRAYWSFYGHAFAGLINSAYGYLHTEDNTNVNLPGEGGQSVLHIKPMLCSVDDLGNPETRLFLDADSEEIPEWLTIGIANEDYEDSFSFDLVVEAAPLPAGVESREATLTFMQEGAKLTLVVKQGGSGPQPEDPSDTDISVLDNLIYVAKAEGFAGTSLDLSLEMKNSAPIRGFQFDLYLPDGVTVAKRANGRIIASLNSNRLPAEDEHTLNVVEQENGSIRFLCSSLYDETFTGNSGELISLTVNIAEGMEDGDYPVIIRDMKLTETNINNYYEQSYVKSTLTINSYIVGDINSDGNVDVSDYTGIANYILGQTPEGFVVKAGDVNGDGQIDVSDYTGVANIILTGSLYSPAATQKVKAANTDISALDNVIYVDPFTALAGEEMDLSIKMKNSAPIRGFQFDLYLPEGVEVVTSSKGKVSCALSAGRLPEDDEHNLNAAVQADGAVRFLCSSMYDETFTGNDGELMTVRIKIASDVANGTYPIQLTKMKLTESDIRNFYEAELIESSITIGEDEYTGIQSVKVDADAKTVFNLAGQKVNGNYKGMVVKQGKKVVVK